MSEKYFVGQKFYNLSPSVNWWDLREPSVCASVKYNVYEVVKVNDKTLRAKDLSGYEVRWKKESFEKYPQSKEKLITIAKERTPLLIKSYKKRIKKYTNKAPEYYICKLWIMCFEETIKMVGLGFDSKCLNETNEKLKKEAKKVKKKIVELEKSV